MEKRARQRREWPWKWLLLISILMPLAAVGAHAQGCAQCLDTTRATPPAVQAAYRHAILLMVGVASTLFIVGLILLRRNP
ncbi:MAG TPA: copper resistance protein CopC [Acidobacteriaceae bacterium]|nr:copper resistance protein CopC [Acidobacteriaceae bacterium]